jgi:hypothetical protein
MALGGDAGADADADGDAGPEDQRTAAPMPAAAVARRSRIVRRRMETSMRKERGAAGARPTAAGLRWVDQNVALSRQL